MPPARPWTDEYTLLCERCGYVIEGLATDGACPECGKPIRESLPERRVGTAWQRGPSVRNLLCTWAATCLKPQRTLDDLAPTEDGHTSLGNICAWCAAVPPCFAVAVAFLAGEPSVRNLPTLFLLIVGGVVLTALWGSVRGLIWIERRGLVLIGRSRGFRITPSWARAVTDHGAVGWVAAGFGLALVVLSPIGMLLINKLNGGHQATTVRLNATNTLVGLTMLSFGFLYFETFAWLGLRRLKYANRRRPEPGATA